MNDIEIMERCKNLFGSYPEMARKMGMTKSGFDYSLKKEKMTKGFIIRLENTLEKMTKEIKDIDLMIMHLPKIEKKIEKRSYAYVWAYKIIQRKNGKKVREYDRTADVEDFGFSTSCVAKCVHGIRSEYKGFTWEKGQRHKIAVPV